MLVIDRAAKFQALWAAVCDVPPPEPSTFMRWCLKFDDALLERAILKTGAKFNRTDTEPERAHRYTTKLLFNLQEEGQFKPLLTA
jgi:hypothetical protein